LVILNVTSIDEYDIQNDHPPLFYISNSSMLATFNITNLEF
jgi:hypothetical protein